MRRNTLVVCTVVAVLAQGGAFAAAKAPVKAVSAARGQQGALLSRERVVLHTPAGDIVIAFWPEAAPKHSEQLLKLFRAGVYDGLHFYRLEGNFVAQTSTALDRLQPLSVEQRALLHPIPAEFSQVYKHHRGVLSMAREDGKPDSAESSFSILLSDAPHLDGQYTIAGEVVRGMDVVDTLMRIPVDAQHHPVIRVGLYASDVYDSEAALQRTILRGPTPVPIPEGALQASLDRDRKPASPLPAPFAGGLGLMIFLGVGGFFLAGRLAPRYIHSLLLVQVLIAAFLLLAQLGPLAAKSPWIGSLLFFGLVSIFKLLGRFERAE